MREIKFRAWDSDKKELKLAFDLSQNPKYWWEDNKDYELEQYTGLKDKNGKEIYEGDILKISDDLIETVTWVDETKWMADKCPVNGWVNHESIYKKPIVIIGNIHENPELLGGN